MSTRRGCRSPEVLAGHGPSPDARGHRPSPWGARTSCTAWRRDCSPSRICSTCSDSSITLGEGGGRVSGSSCGQGSTCLYPLHPTLPLTHRLPQLVQCICIPCLAGSEGDSEEATLCRQDKVISWGWEEMTWVTASGSLKQTTLPWQNLTPKHNHLWPTKHSFTQMSRAGKSLPAARGHTASTLLRLRKLSSVPVPCSTLPGSRHSWGLLPWAAWPSSLHPVPSPLSCQCRRCAKCFS